ncbi:MAG: hypothetical protein R2867_13995 [Caldilineaceae bacterium]
MSWKLSLFICVITASLLTACNRPNPTATAPSAPTATVAAAATALPATATTAPPTVEPTAAPAEETPAPTTTAIAVDPNTARATLATMLLDTLQVSVPVTSGVGINGAVAFPLETTDSRVLWLAHTVGIHSFEPEQFHIMAIYAQTADGWLELARQEFAAGGTPDAPTFSPDYLGDEGVTQVEVEPDHLWLQVEGGVGAHSGVYGLFSFDGATFTAQINGFSSSPGVGRVVDVNNDGINEVLLDATDYYVFCYACGVRVIQWEIYRWDGVEMRSVVLAPLGDAAPEAVRSFNETLLALVEAGLWKDAQALLDDALLFSYTEPTLQWNLAYVRVNAEARQNAATEDVAYPLLSKVFYGDYAGAVEIMREVGADGLFIPATELVVGTVADGWQTELADRLVNNATAALMQQPDLAAAYFVRGWGEYVRDFDEAAALPDVQKAAELAPDDELYRKSVEFLTE